MAPLISILILWTVSVEARKMNQNIPMREPPSMKPHYQQLHFTETGKQIKLECPISATQHNIFIIWEKQITSDHNKTPTDYNNLSHLDISYQKVVPSLVRNGRLRIKKAKVEDAGTYRCTAINGFGSNIDSQWRLNKVGLILASGIVSLAGLVVLATYIINKCKMDGGPVFHRSGGSDYILRRFLSTPDEHVFNHNNNNNNNHNCNKTTTLHRPTNGRNVFPLPAIDTVASLEPKMHNIFKSYNNNGYRVVTVQQASAVPIHHHIPAKHPILRNHGYFTNSPEQYIPAYYDISQNHIIPNNLASNLINTTTSPSNFNNRTMMVNVLSRFVSSLNSNVVNIGSRRSSVHNDRDVECGQSAVNRIYNINRISRNINNNNHVNNNCINNNHINSNNNYNNKRVIQVNNNNYTKGNSFNKRINDNIICDRNNTIGVHRPSFAKFHWMVNNKNDLISTTSLNSARATISISP
ncbi:hypothetical protein HELRODRAFT_178735 [Helobdella robusta]|uniref:Ig-like domain-containing protein n=1 Tax=Helobdella robusta TaxID=6412 RepID=T1FDN1_HELRO|nr:hypothetical protein HELRODRAFT_178735 [Helobdella robusta]ESN96935.1 hypothetical protein HELRODRAFT_178735 [Helobdella robusta]